MNRYGRGLCFAGVLLVALTACRPRGSDLSDVSDGRYRLGTSHYINHGRYAGFYLMLCPEKKGYTTEIFKTECINPFLMKWQQRDQYIRAAFYRVPENFERRIIDAKVSGLTAEVTNRRNEKDRVRKELQDNLTAGEKNYQKLGHFLAIASGDGKGSLALLQSDLDKIAASAVDEYKIDLSAIEPRALTEEKVFSAFEKVGVIGLRDRRSDRNERVVDGQITCDCLRTPAAFRTSSRRQGPAPNAPYVQEKCNAYEVDPDICWNAPNNRCYCSSPFAKTFTPTPGKKCFAYEKDPPECEVTDAEQTRSNNAYDTATHYLQLNNELKMLQKSIADATSSQGKWEERKKVILSQIQTIEGELTRINERLQPHALLEALNIGATRVEFANTFNQVFSAYWDTKAEVQVRSVPAFLKRIAELFDLRINCLVAEKFPELKNTLSIQPCDSNNEGETRFGNEDLVDINQLKLGRYHHPTLKYLRIARDGRGTFIAPANPTTLDLSGYLGACNNQVCDIQNIAGIRIAALSATSFMIINSIGDTWRFEYFEERLDTGVYVEVVEATKSDPKKSSSSEAATTPALPAPLRFKVNVKGDGGFFDVTVCGLEPDLTALRTMNYKCKNDLRCYASNDFFYLDIVNGRRFSVRFDDKHGLLNMQYAGPIDDTEHDCDPKKTFPFYPPQLVSADDEGAPEGGGLVIDGKTVQLDKFYYNSESKRFIFLDQKGGVIRVRPDQDRRNWTTSSELVRAVTPEVVFHKCRQNYCSNDSGSQITFSSNRSFHLYLNGTQGEFDLGTFELHP